MGDFSWPDVVREHCTAGTNRFRRFLKLLDDGLFHGAGTKDLGKMPSLICCLLTERVSCVKESLVALLATVITKKPTEFKNLC